ncbi:MAG: RNA 2'-phosphotransferase [Anaerolineales bacterium]|nr:RNA 2'-phosphotransferase [Anaerolineales bacterium]
MRGSDRRVRISKFLSYVLRHEPGAVGVELDPGGWADVDALLEGARREGRQLDREDLEWVIEASDKQRFEMSEDGRAIRARYGHSVPVDLELEPQSPPELLFHGTSERALDSIMERGLQPGSRNLVHLSPDRATAREVGARHGRPVVLQVAAAEMQSDGYHFFHPAEVIWLVPQVPPEYLSID